MEASGVPDEDQRGPLARADEHVTPEFGSESFHCMHCGVLAAQEWEHLLMRPGMGIGYVDCWRCECHNCSDISYWREEAIGGRLVDPQVGGGPRPHPDMPEEVQKDFEEARTIVMQSPRGACALLRLAVQKLCSELGESGTNINDDIAALVQKGLSVEVQQALDSLRVIGNNAVHPGEMDLTDDTETASALFELLNFIVEDRISQPKKREEIFAKLPAKAVAAIQRRDGS
ncbi:MAG TPA: DUF4145 domain-containing protein [Solirubrobacterales bacterium]|nr:DUF4145 domain-containing protein [Solirubrobacterales bacterium]